VLFDALRLISSGRTGSTEQLARSLGVEPGLVRQMLEDLVRLGYLRPSGRDCPSACQTCPLSNTCFGLPQMWVLTEKGQRAAAEPKTVSSG